MPAKMASRLLLLPDQNKYTNAAILSTINFIKVAAITARTEALGFFLSMDLVCMARLNTLNINNKILDANTTRESILCLSRSF